MIYITLILLFIIISFYSNIYTNFYNYSKPVGYKVLEFACKYKIITNQHEIIDNLWLGNYKSALDKDFLKSKNIKLIINLSTDLKFTNLNIDKYRIPIKDNRSKHSNDGIIFHFNIIYHKINKIINESNGGVLIHCRAGMQRSAAFVALYLIKKNKIKFNKAKKIITSKRCIVFYPTVNFIKSIKHIEKKCLSK